jgi:hypothetical protein
MVFQAQNPDCRNFIEQVLQLPSFGARHPAKSNWRLKLGPITFSTAE